MLSLPPRPKTREVQDTQLLLTSQFSGGYILLPLQKTRLKPASKVNIISES